VKLVNSSLDIGIALSKCNFIFYNSHCVHHILMECFYVCDICTIISSFAFDCLNSKRHSFCGIRVSILELPQVLECFLTDIGAKSILVFFNIGVWNRPVVLLEELLLALDHWACYDGSIVVTILIFRSIPQPYLPLYVPINLVQINIRERFFQGWTKNKYVFCTLMGSKVFYFFSRLLHQLNRNWWEKMIVIHAKIL
jgi:hypothetical protein